MSSYLRRCTLILLMTVVAVVGCGSDDSGDQSDPNNQSENSEEEPVNGEEDPTDNDDDPTGNDDDPTDNDDDPTDNSDDPTDNSDDPTDNDDDPTDNGDDPTDDDDDPTDNGDDPQVEPGILELTVVGLDSVEGVSPQPDVSVVGNEITKDVSNAGTTSMQLPAGEYEVEVEEVSEGPAVFTAASETVAIEVDETKSYEVKYEAIGGDLSILGGDHPEVASLEATVDGPDYSETLSGETTAEDLLPGSYTVTFEDHESADGVWRESQGSYGVEISSGSETVVEPSYELVEGQLEVTISGLDTVAGESPEPEVLIEGPLADETITSAGQNTIELPVGNYDVQPSMVSSGIAEFEAEEQTIDVVEGSTAAVTVDYEVIPGELTVGYSDHPSPSNFEATVEGPDFSESIDGETTFEEVVPGAYTISFSSYSTGDIIWDPVVAEEEVIVESGSSLEVMSDYEMRKGTLEVNMSIPEGVSVSFNVVTDGGTVVQGFNTTGSGLESIELTPGDYEVEAGLVSDEWNNVFQFEGVGESFSIASAQTHTQGVSTQKPSVVTVADDDGDEYGSLREVIGRVNSGTEVRFDEAISTIELEDTVVIDKPIHLMGPDDGYVGITQASGSGSYTLFEVDYAGSEEDVIHFEGIEFFDALAMHGAAILADTLENATLQIFDCKFSDLEASQRGGALRVVTEGGRVHIVDGDFHDNSSGSVGGAIYFSHDSDDSGELIIDQSDFMSNDAGNNGGAVAIQRGDITIENSYFGANESQSNGGAISLSTGTATWLASSEFIGNNSDSHGGAIYNSGDLSADKILVEDNEADGDGGGIWMSYDRAGSIERSVVRGNSAEGKGGGLRLLGGDRGFTPPSSVPPRYYVDRLLIDGNSADDGGGVYFTGDSDVTFGTFPLFVKSTTVAENEGDGIIWSSNASGRILFSSIIGNECAPGSGICYGTGIMVRDDASGLRLRGSVFADHVPVGFGSFGEDVTIQGDGPTVISDGYNLINYVSDEDYFSEESTDVLNAGYSYAWSQSMDGDSAEDALKRVAETDEGTVGYRDIPPEECVYTFNLTTIGGGSTVEYRLFSDQRGMARPSGAYCSSGAWEPDSHFEDFAGVDVGDSPGSGSFTGNDDRSWDYSDAYSDFDDDRIILDQEGASMSSTDIESLVSGANSVDSMAIIYEAVGPESDGDRQVRVRADGTVLGTSGSFNSGEGVLVIDDFQGFQDGDGFELEIENNAPGGNGAIAIKQVVWR